MSVNGKLKELETRVENMVKDFTTLTVRTFSGPVTATFDQPSKTWILSGTDKLELRAYTVIKLDGDTDTVLPVKDGGVIDQEILAIHAQTVKASSEARAALIKGIVELF